MTNEKEYLDLSSLDQHFYTKISNVNNSVLHKRMFDVVLSFFLLLILSPLCLLIVLIINLESPGGAIFSQYRVGLNGIPFKIFKFRSMYIKSAEFDGVSVAIDDSRITKTGSFLRKHRIDEWPQLVNVLKGEMSLVGPRPEQIEIFDELVEVIPSYKLRNLVRPGITGWAQVNVGYTNDLIGARRKVAYDLYYIQNASLKLELKTVWLTLKVIFTGFGSR